MGVTQAIDITTEERKAILALLQRHLPSTGAWVYGSRAKWTSRSQSDLDLVVFATPEQWRQIGHLREAFDESSLPFRVDLFVWDEVPESFRNRIEADHVELVKHGNPESVCNGWISMILGDVCSKIGSGATPRGGRDVYQKNEPFSLIRSQNVYNDGFRHDGLVFINERQATELSNVEVRAGDVLLNITGDSVARACQVAPNALPARVNQHVVIIRPDSRKLSARFLRYFLVHPETQAMLLSWAGSGGTRNALTKSMIESFHVYAPADVTEQRAIAHVLGTLDDKIELNRRMNATLEAMARALFWSWFVDFDPVRAKMEGRDTGLPKDLADLFPDRLVDSELGKVPEGWALAPLPKLIEVNPQRPLRKGQVAPYLDMANMPTRGHAPDSVVQRPFGSGMRFANGDTLIARITPCLENGKTAYVDFLRDDEIGWGSTEYIVLKPMHPLPSEFAYCLARSTRFREFAIRNMSGTSGRQRVPATALSGFSIPLPPAQLVAEFGRMAQCLLGRARSAVNECRTLVTLRDTLLPKLVSGEFRVTVQDREAGRTLGSAPEKRSGLDVA